MTVTSSVGNLGKRNLNSLQAANRVQSKKDRDDQLLGKKNTIWSSFKTREGGQRALWSHSPIMHEVRGGKEPG